MGFPNRQEAGLQGLVDILHGLDLALGELALALVLAALQSDTAQV